MSDKPDDDPFADSPEHARERIRITIAGHWLSTARILGDPTPDEDVVRKAGYANMGEYFAAAFAGPMTIESFAHLMRRLHRKPIWREAADGEGASEEGGFSRRSLDPALDMAIRAVLRRAVRSNQPFISADPAGGQPHLNPLACARWIDSMPSERGLLPPELRDYLGREEPGSERGRKAAPRLSAVAAELGEIYPAGPPASPDREVMRKDVERKIGPISLATLGRARKKAWPTE
jgi:hypothetical protein